MSQNDPELMASDSETLILQRVAALETGQSRTTEDIHAIRRDMHDVAETLQDMAKPKWGTWAAMAGVALMVFFAWDGSRTTSRSKMESAIQRIDSAMAEQNRWMGGVETSIVHLKDRQLQYDSLASRVYALEKSEGK